MERLPFLAKYEKNGKICKHCGNFITKDALRLAKVMPSLLHDGFITRSFHPDCFFLEAKPTSTSEFANFNNLRWEDQETIRNKIGAGGASTSGTNAGGSESGGGKKRAYDMDEDFKIEYAKSNRKTCTACEESILKDDIRVSKMDYESEKGQRRGGMNRWHHLDCFVQIRSEMGFFDSGDVIPGYRDLSKKDKAKVKAALPKIKNTDGPDVKKVKKEEEPASKKEEKLLQQQNEEMFEFRDKLMNVPKKDLKSLLDFNNQYVSYTRADKMDHLADLMTFGAIEICKKCKNGKFIFLSGVGYTCSGDLTEWIKCDEILAAPKRRFFLIPNELKKKYQFLDDYVPRTADRLFKLSPKQKKKVGNTKTNDGPKVKKGPLPLEGMQFVIAGKLNKTHEELKKEIMLLGGTVSSSVSQSTTAVISTEEALQQGGTRFTDAKKFNIQVVSEDFIEATKDLKNTPIDLITRKNICSWGADPTSRVNNSIAKSTSSLARSDKSIYHKSSSVDIYLKLKDGGAEVPDSHLEDIPSNTSEINFIGQRNSPGDQKLKLQCLTASKPSPRSLIRSAGVNNNQLSLFQQPTQMQPVSSPIPKQKQQQQQQQQQQSQTTFNPQTPVKQPQLSDSSSEMRQKMVQEKSNELNRIQQGQVTPPREIMKNQDCQSSSEVDSTSPSDYDAGIAYLQQIISNPAETIVQHQIKGHVAKMLVVLPKNVQRLITFDVPNEECTVQDLLDQARIPFESDTTISLVTNKKLNINYIVENERGILGADLPDMPDDKSDTNECISSNYVEQQQEDPKNIPKYVDGKLAVCLTCSIASMDSNRCIRCRAKLPNDARQTADARQIATASKRGRGGVRTAGRVAKNKPPKEPEYLTLSSDEDEHGNDSLLSTKKLINKNNSNCIQSKDNNVNNDNSGNSNKNCSYLNNIVDDEPDLIVDKELIITNNPVSDNDCDNSTDNSDEMNKCGNAGGDDDDDDDDDDNENNDGSMETGLECRTVRIGSTNDARQIATASNHGRGGVGTAGQVVENKPPKELECLKLSSDEDDNANDCLSSSKKIIPIATKVKLIIFIMIIVVLVITIVII